MSDPTTTTTPPSRAELVAALQAIERARGQINAALRAPDAAPEVRLDAWRRALGTLRVLHCEGRTETREG